VILGAVQIVEAVQNASPLRVLAGRATCLPRVSRGPPYLFHKRRRECYFAHVEIQISPIFVNS